MTCIIGIVDGDRVWVGSDSCMSTNWMKTTVSKPRVVRLSPERSLIAASTGDLRLLNLLHTFPYPVTKLASSEAHSYIMGTFPDRLREFASERGFLETTNGRASLGDNSVLIAFGSAIYHVGALFGVHKVGRSFHAIGSGAEVAMGALQVMGKRASPQVRIRRALEAASEIAQQVAPPFEIFHT